MKTKRNVTRHQCVKCKQRKALYRARRGWKAARDHELCRQCFQSSLDQARAAQLRLLVALDDRKRHKEDDERTLVMRRALPDTY